MVDSQITKGTNDQVVCFLSVSEIVATGVRALVKLLHSGMVIRGIVQGPGIRGDSAFGRHHVSFGTIRCVGVAVRGVIRPCGKT